VVESSVMVLDWAGRPTALSSRYTTLVCDRQSSATDDDSLCMQHQVIWHVQE
jgi:hypothetical protein